MAKEEKYAVIIAGGSGTRLWPLSRKEKPKQFLKIFDDKSLIQSTFERIRKLFPLKNIFVVTSEELVSKTQKELPWLPAKNILGEPSPKNTTAAIWLAAKHIEARDPDAVFSSFAADHYIKKEKVFLDTLVTSQKAATKGDYIVTIGIEPTSAHTGFGYIQVDGKHFKIDNKPVFKIKEFKEKPDQAAARAYFASGEYFWNANTNSYKVSTLLKAIKTHVPVIDKSFAKDPLKDRKTFTKGWDKLPSEPIDTAILEKAENVLMIPGKFPWFDVGNWEVIYSLLSKGKKQNVVISEADEHIEIDSSGCLIYADGGVVVTIGLDDVVVIKTGDKVAVFPRSRSEEIKKIVEKLKKEKKHKFL